MLLIQYKYLRIRKIKITHTIIKDFQIYMTLSYYQDRASAVSFPSTKINFIHIHECLCTRIEQKRKQLSGEASMRLRKKHPN